LLGQFGLIDQGALDRWATPEQYAQKLAFTLCESCRFGLTACENGNVHVWRSRSKFSTFVARHLEMHTGKIGFSLSHKIHIMGE
jgi:hypothetical protein